VTGPVVDSDHFLQKAALNKKLLTTYRTKALQSKKKKWNQANLQNRIKLRQYRTQLYNRLEIQQINKKLMKKWEIL